MAHALGRPVATGLKGVVVEGGVGALRARGGRSGRDVTMLTLPAVVSVKEGLNLPRFPSVPAKIRAQKKPVLATEVGPPGAAPREAAPRVIPEGQAKQAEILGEGAGAAPRVVELLRELGVA